MVDLDPNLDPLQKLEKQLTSHEPEVFAADAQIASPRNPIFHRLDVPTVGLNNPKELQQIELLQHQIDLTQAFIPFLYSYRSISRAVNKDNYLKPASNHPELQSELMELYNKLFTPHLQRIIDLNNAMLDAAEHLGRTVTNMDYIPSCVFYEKLVEFFDVLFNLDQMKQLKSGLTNDLSFFRRQKSLEQDLVEQTGKAAFFLGTRFFALNKLKEQPMAKSPEPQTIKFFVGFLEFCCGYYRRALLPKQKSSIVISMVTSLYVMEQKNLTVKDNLTPVFQILAENPIVPLYAEMNFKPFEVLKEMKTFETPKGINVAISNDQIKQYASQYLLTAKISQFREMFKNNLNKINTVSRTGKIEDINIIYDVIKCISEMAASIMNQSAFKFAIPHVKKDTDKIQSNSFYDNQVKLNYGSDELDVLIEVIGYLKTLVGLAIKAEPYVMEHVYLYVAKSINDFFEKVDGLLTLAEKKKEKDAISVLEAIKAIFQQGDTSKDSKKKKSLSTVPPSTHQLDVFRNQISGLSGPSSIFYDKKGKLRGFVKKSFIEDFQKFADECQRYYALINYSQVIRENTNLGSLWFRETCLDIEGQLQFPVRSSLPFILAEHVLNSSFRPNLHDCVFFPLEIYNDAAALSINTFNSQFLYKEVEAEVSLCVDMISFTFGHTFFKFCRESAAAAHMPPECAAVNIIVPTPIRYSSMVKQNKLQLLGSPINFNLITTQKVNETIEKELSTLVSTLTDFRLLPYVNRMVKILRTTHSFLLKHGLLLDDFDSIWKSARGAVQPLSPSTNLAAVVISALDVPHMTYNSVTRRFLPTKELTIPQASNDDWVKLYTKLSRQDVMFIGTEHLEALVELLDDGELSSFISNTLGRIEDELQKSLDLYMQVASCLRLLPAKSKDDLAGYYSFISDAYAEMNHPLLGQLFNSLRNVGNMVSLIYMIETELTPIGGDHSLMASVIQIFRELLVNNRGLFVVQEFEHDNVITHRTFPALWSVLEFLLCTPSQVKLSDQLKVANPIETFGDGVIVSAYCLILLAGEGGMYQYDSVCAHTLKLYDVQKVTAPKGPLQNFVYHASIVDQARNFTDIMVHPFLSSLEPL